MEHKIVGIDECRCHKCNKIIKKSSIKCPFCGYIRGKGPEDEQYNEQNQANYQQQEPQGRSFSYTTGNGGLLGCLVVLFGLFFIFFHTVLSLFRFILHFIFGGFR